MIKMDRFIFYFIIGGTFIMGILIGRVTDAINYMNTPPTETIRPFESGGISDSAEIMRYNDVDSLMRRPCP